MQKEIASCNKQIMDEKHLFNALWRIYNRPERPLPWAFGGNLPWDDPEFSARMLREHLDEAHGAATRQAGERQAQLEWMWDKLGLYAGANLLDVTCGPGLYAVLLAQRGVNVVGVDFGPASIAYAKELAVKAGVTELCQFVQSDVRGMDFGTEQYDAAILLYGQLAVMTRDEAKNVLANILDSLKPGGKLCVELLNQDTVDKSNSNWWYTDDSGLWGDAPFLHLGERFWIEEEALSVERYHILHLETGQMDEIQLCDQTYAVDAVVAMMKDVGFTAVSVYPAWDSIPLYDLNEWIVYVAEK